MLSQADDGGQGLTLTQTQPADFEGPVTILFLKEFSKMTGFISRVFVNLIVSLAEICGLIFKALVC